MRAAATMQGFSDAHTSIFGAYFMGACSALVSVSVGYLVTKVQPSCRRVFLFVFLCWLSSPSFMCMSIFADAPCFT